MPEQPTILEEAQFLTRGNRNADYGSPLDDYIRTAKIWSAILGTEVTAEQAMLCMIGVKISRQCHRPKRDNLVDICGYADCIDRAMEEREQKPLPPMPPPIPAKLNASFTRPTFDLTEDE